MVLISLFSIANAEIFINESFESGSLPTNWSVFDGSQNFVYTPAIEGVYSLAGSGNGFLRFPNWSMDYLFIYGMKNYSVLFNITDDQAGAVDIFYFTPNCRAGLSGGVTNHHIHYTFNDGTSETTGSYAIPLNEIFKLVAEYDGYGIDVSLYNYTTGALIESLGEVGCDYSSNFNLYYLFETKDYYIFDNFVVQNISVIPAVNNPPIMSSLTFSPSVIYPLTPITLTATVSDADGNLNNCLLLGNYTNTTYYDNATGYSDTCQFVVNHGMTAGNTLSFLANVSDTNGEYDYKIINVSITAFNVSGAVTNISVYNCPETKTELSIIGLLAFMGLALVFAGLLKSNARFLGIMGGILIAVTGMFLRGCDQTVSIIIVITGVVCAVAVFFIGVTKK